jgi:hypothetical protein
MALSYIPPLDVLNEPIEDSFNVAQKQVIFITVMSIES